MNYGPQGSSYPRDLAQGRQAGVAAFFRYVYAWMALALTVTGVASVLTLSEPALLMMVARYNLFFGLGVLGLGVMMGRNLTTMKASTAAQLFLLYSAAQGVWLAPLLHLYASASVAKAFFITGGMFGATALYGYSAKKELTGVGQFATIGLIGGLLAIVVNLFLRSPAVDYVVSCALVLVFSCLTAYDNQRLRQMYVQAGGTANLAIFGAMTLYLNFINLFLSVLRLFGDRRE